MTEQLSLTHSFPIKGSVYEKIMREEEIWYILGILQSTEIKSKILSQGRSLPLFRCIQSQVQQRREVDRTCNLRNITELPKFSLNSSMFPCIPQAFRLPALCSRHPSLPALTCPGSSWPSREEPLSSPRAAPAPQARCSPAILVPRIRDSWKSLRKEARPPHPQHAFRLLSSALLVASPDVFCSMCPLCSHPLAQLLLPCNIRRHVPSPPTRVQSPASSLGWGGNSFCFCSFSHCPIFSMGPIQIS
ncbi:uncharacterized protein LOC129654085 [Bubalus kerabau]|uniref:uncharacterized protein LOC129654085 n=1 Tax=Bubalus carabanensis TaxID=3119969 RepID=UPI00244E76AF|nr:uncharacterized protein LOC129654085 [Bubalus carabanensis]